MLVFILGYYYFKASKNAVKKVFQWTVYGRTAVLIFFIVLVLLDFVPSILILCSASATSISPERAKSVS